MSRAMVQDASDSEPETAVPDPDEEDIDDFVESDIVRRRHVDPSSSSSSSSSSSPSTSQNHQQQQQQQQQQQHDPQAQLRHEQFKAFHTLYPVYFDASRSRAHGRRVAASLAVHDPLARDIATACSSLGLPTLLEQDKTHPQDWANPGRVKVALRQRDAARAPLANKHHLCLVVARHLALHPTTPDSPALRVRMPPPGGGAPQLLPPLDKPYPLPAVPRGWKIGRLLPYLSPAMTGGGVSENLFKDIIKEMQGGANPMSALMPAPHQPTQGASAGTAAKKKDKKGKGRA